ncbi:DUF2837 family protein [Venturia nashicola]|uniref:DUF2837 family protein n=1 Tax=Venturia nashicola TaxID=86259 RepID=A0A4Z1NQE5_9PEZI|nr:DUF2837 family protein [Venturia nashicola]
MRCVDVEVDGCGCGCGWNTEHRIQNTEYRTQNTEHRIQNTEYRTQNTEYRIQNTEHRWKEQTTPSHLPAKKVQVQPVLCSVHSSTEQSMLCKQELHVAFSRINQASTMAPVLAAWGERPRNSGRLPRSALSQSRFKNQDTGHFTSRAETVTPAESD